MIFVAGKGFVLLISILVLGGTSLKGDLIAPAFTSNLCVSAAAAAVAAACLPFKIHEFVTLINLPGKLPYKKKELNNSLRKLQVIGAFVLVFWRC